MKDWRGMEWTEEIQQAHKSYREALKKGFNRCLKDDVAYFNQFFKREIRYVEFETGSEYNDYNGYDLAIYTVYFFDENKNNIDIEDPNHFKPEYLDEDGELLESVSLLHLEVYDCFAYGDYTTVIEELDLDVSMIDVKELEVN